jgi:hypothetical protein
LKKNKPYTRRYSKDDLQNIKKWRSNLTFFDFNIDWEDPDVFFVKFYFDNFDEMSFILKTLGIALERIPENYERIIPGKSYIESKGEIMPRREIQEFPNYFQPKFVDVIDISIHCWIAYGKITLTIASKDDYTYDLTQLKYEKALKIEKLIKDKALTKYVSKFRSCESIDLE